MYTFETKPGLTDRMIDDIMPPHCSVPIADVFDAMAEGVAAQQREDRGLWERPQERNNPILLCRSIALAWISLFLWPLKALL
jgi:hypothetical protein